MLQPPATRGAYSPQVPGRLSPPGAKNHTAVPIQLSIVYVYDFAPDLYDYSKLVDSSAKIRTS